MIPTDKELKVTIQEDKRKGKRCFICGGLKRENKGRPCYRSGRHYYGKKAIRQLIFGKE